MIAVTFAIALKPSDGQARSKLAQSHLAVNHLSGQHATQYAAAMHHGWRWSRYASRHVSLRYWASSGLQCVPFARENTGIELSGNAVTWWDKAEGLYERGARPEVGSILNFRATGHMPMGHVAVVTNVVNGRVIQIDHANWSAPGAISRDIDVVDVSEHNDWTAVRVGGATETANYGSIYPTYGFIYDRPDSGVMLANSSVTPAPMLAAPPADLRTAAERIHTAVAPTAPEEVAEATDDDVSASRGLRHFHHAHFARTAGRSHIHLAFSEVEPRSRGDLEPRSHHLAAKSIVHASATHATAHHLRH